MQAVRPVQVDCSQYDEMTAYCDVSRVSRANVLREALGIFFRDVAPRRLAALREASKSSVAEHSSGAQAAAQSPGG